MDFQPIDELLIRTSFLQGAQGWAVFGSEQAVPA